MYVTICHLTLHENLFYATREIGRLYETGRYLHNYGLTYALELAVAPYFNSVSVPRYREDFAALNSQNLYVTPAKPINVQFELNTFKYADNRYHVQMEQSSRNTPTFGRAKELATASTFRFALISNEPRKVPCWIRLGKWMSKAELRAEDPIKLGDEKQGDFISGFPVNPLDLPSMTALKSYDLISMPPVSLLDNTRLQGAYYRLTDELYLPAGMAYRFP